MLATRAEDIGEQLRGAGLRRTEARLRVLGALRRATVPLSHASVSADLEDMDPVTLYRTLATLESAGLVHRVHGIDGVARYGSQPAADGCPGNHAHFLCSSCGGAWCLHDQPMPRVEVPPGASVRGRHLLAWGCCSTCATSASR